MKINFSPPDITELEINEVVEALKKWLDYNWSAHKRIREKDCGTVRYT